MKPIIPILLCLGTVYYVYSVTKPINVAIQQTSNFVQEYNKKAQAYAAQDIYADFVEATRRLNSW